MNNKIKSIVIITLVFAGGILIGRWLTNNYTSVEGGSSDQTTQSSESEVSVWTCSMHPQIQSPDPGICPICEMDLTPMTSDSGNDPFTLTMTENAIRLANIQTTVIGSGQTEVSSDDAWRIHGKILPDERNVYSQTLRIEGRIEALHVTYEGMSVSEGSTVAKMYSPEIVAAQRELLEAKKMANTQPELLEAARRKLKYLKISPEFIQKVEESGEVIETFPLQAGRSGFVINKKVEPGDHVSSGQVLFDIYNLSSVWAVFDIYEKDIGKIREGEWIEFSAPGIPGQSFRTRIEFISPLLNQESRTIRVRGQVNNQNRLLKPEMLIQGQLTTGRSGGNDRLLIPKTAVLWTGRESVAYVQDTTMDIPTFAFREITLGSESGPHYVVLDGLNAGDRVVTHGVFAVDAAAQLNNQRSMMNRLIGEDAAEEEQDAWEKIEQVDPDIVTEGARKDLNQILEAYIALKDELIEGDHDKVLAALTHLQSVSDQISSRNDMDEYNDTWNEHVKNVKSHLDLTAQKDGVEEWRTAFSPLSQVMIYWILEFGNPGEQEVFVQHCPMANDDEGGDWLSYDPKIRNPYFGDAMMACGITKETLSSE